MAKNKIIDGCFWGLSFALVALMIFSAVTVYKALIPNFPKIDSPDVLVEQSRELIEAMLLSDSDVVEVPREQWPPAIEALRPRFVSLVRQGGSGKESAVHYVDIVISTGGIGGNYGYFVCFAGKGAVVLPFVRGNSDLIFENEAASIIRYVAD